MEVRRRINSLIDALHLDTALDRAIVPGYTRVGYLVRRSTWPVDDPAPGSLSGRTVLVTGANSGIGLAIAEGVARLGASVLLTVRNSGRGLQAREEILAAVPGADVRVEVCDVSDLTAVRAFAADLTSRLSRVDVLVHNAGLLPPNRAETDGGHEITLATHVLGPVLLTELLAPALAAAPDPRVIFMSSGGMYTQALPIADPEYRDGRYRGSVAYARTKRIQVALTPLLAERYAMQHISVYCMHPGWADTPGVADSLPIFRKFNGPLLRSAEEGADTAVWLAATAPTPRSGLFYHDRRPRPDSYLPFTHTNDADRQAIWRFCADAVGIDEGD